MRAVWVSILLGTVAACGCSRSNNTAQVNDSASASTVQPQPSAASSSISATSQSIGFDRNDYPGDDTMIALRKDFVFTSYWLTTPPGDDTNTWVGKRELLKQQGWGFLVLANGKLEAEILKARKAGTSPANLARKDAAVAIAAAKSEQFPARTIVFLDQEEGGRLTDVQAAYLLAWTEAVAASDFRPGVYASGQRVQDDPGVWIDTVQDIRDRVKKGGLHEVAIFDAQDECSPAPGCTLQAKPLSAAGEPDLVAWQYSQSPRRPEITKSCAKTYAADGNCYAPEFPKLFLDMDVADSPDPSHGR
jgi:Domain of unknown function (DUF1906)